MYLGQVFGTVVKMPASPTEGNASTLCLQILAH